MSPGTKDINVTGRTARDLFPGLFPKEGEKKRKHVAPPPPPDIRWLIDGSQRVAEDKFGSAPMALAFFTDKNGESLIEEAAVKMGYNVDLPPSPVHAVKKLKAFRYELVISTTGDAADEIHSFMCRLSSATRRLMYYVLVGPHLHTLYNLEALAFSANLVVNTQDLRYLETILKKGFQDYQSLFGPLLEIAGQSPLQHR